MRSSPKDSPECRVWQWGIRRAQRGAPKEFGEACRMNETGAQGPACLAPTRRPAGPTFPGKKEFFLTTLGEERVYRKKNRRSVWQLK